MLFRRIVLSAVIVGICGGLFLSMLQNMQLLQLILDAEQYEISTQALENTSLQSHTSTITSSVSSPSVNGHSHVQSVWTPANGLERRSYTFGSNIVAAIGFAVILIALMSFGNKRLTPGSGFLWGLSGFTVFFLAPSLGLPPELPGMQTAELGARQMWWLMTVVCTAAGLACIAFAEKYYKYVGIVLLALPHLIGAPQAPSSRFTHPDASAVATLESLHSQFVQLAALVNFAYWLLLGLMSALLVQKYVKRAEKHTAENPQSQL